LCKVIFPGVGALRKSFSDNAVQILSVKGIHIGIQKTLKEMNTIIADINEVLSPITKSVKEVP